MLFVCYSQPAFAGFWDAVGACFTDPCNCGYSNKTRYEYWDGETLNKGYKNELCPPWNKRGGRDANTCLRKDSFPGAGIGYYENICGEETPESTYFHPKIRVRGQQCNFTACWHTSTTLDWDGECVTLAGGYGFPLHRMCARVAIPAEPIKLQSDPGYVEDKVYDSADPGYTLGKHLNFEGATKDDEPIITSDGEFIILESPKLCVYYDPSFFSFEDGFDIMDLDPNEQTFHKTTDVHPIVQVIIFLVNAASSIAAAPFNLLSAVMDMAPSTGGDDESSTNMFSALGDLIDLMGEGIIAALEYIGQINRAVNDKVYGCVNLPLGPFPPPFCKTAEPLFQLAQTQRICSAGEVSKKGKECVISKVRNNYVHNAVRIGYKNFIPLCTDGENPMNTEKCIMIDNADAFMSASAMHLATAFRDVIKHCDNAASGAPCVRSKIAHQCSILDEEGCKDGFRVVYAQNIGGKIIMPSNYYVDNMNDCPDNSKSSCQQIWGVNIGEFADIALPFPAVQEAHDITPLNNVIRLTDKNGKDFAFEVKIVRNSEYDSVRKFMQDPGQICVLEGDVVAGCEDRALHGKPLMHDCAGGIIDGITCISSYFDPQMIVSYKEGEVGAEDITSVLLEPESVYNTSDSLNYVINLAGDEFDSFVTDDSYIVKPFAGPNAPNPASIFGTYKDNILPVVDGVVNPDAVFLHDLEYINDKYHLGGKHLCLNKTGLRKCPEGKEMCVLTNLLNRDTVDCSIFVQKAADNMPMGVCTPAQTANCSAIVDSLPIKTGGSLAVRSCPNNIKCYDGGVELCKVSMDPKDRVYPTYGGVDGISDSDYYNTSASSGHAGAPTGVSINYDQKLHAVRDKTPVEMGLCYPIPRGSCAEEDDYSKRNGFAYWPETIVGEVAIGTCPVGRVPEAPLERYCIPKAETQTFAFEDLYHTDGDGNKIYTNVRCKVVTCSGSADYSEDNGFAKWTSAEYNKNSTGECQPGWRPVNTLTRKCIQKPGTEEYILEPLYQEQGGVKVYNDVKCELIP